MKKLAALCLVAVVFACGKRGDPRPPLPVIPKATSDLVVTQRGSKLILAWSYPSVTAAGQGLHDLRRVVVYRYTEELPVLPTGADPKTLMPADVDPTVPPAFSQFARVPTIGPVQFSKLKERLDSIESANLPAATAGAKLVYEDTPPFRTRDGRPIRYTYSVVAESISARSDLSNLVTIVPLDVPQPPAGVTATPRPEGVVISWSKPEKAATGDAKPFLIGYNVYRLSASETLDQFAVAANTSPVAGTTFVDSPAFGTYTYRVTAVASRATPRIESDPSAPVVATFKDLVPPAKPASATALIEPNSVRLIWDPVEAPDLAGYKVYRTEGVGHDDIKEVATASMFPKPLAATTFVDRAASLGIAYRYGITAVDKNGNESDKTWTAWVVVPKTP